MKLAVCLASVCGLGCPISMAAQCVCVKRFHFWGNFLPGDRPGTEKHLTATGKGTHSVITHGGVEINGPNWAYRYFCPL